MLTEWEILVSMKIENADDIKDTHVFKQYYWNEQDQKTYLKMSEKYNDVSQIWRHETSCNWLKTTQKVPVTKYVMLKHPHVFQ